MSANAGEKISGWGLVAVRLVPLAWLAMVMFLLPPLQLSEAAAKTSMALFGFGLCLSILLIRYRKATGTKRMIQIGYLVLAIPVALVWLKLSLWARWIMSVMSISLLFINYLKWINQKDRGNR